MTDDFSRPEQAEDICKSLELAVLKYFPCPTEDVDTFLFGQANDDCTSHKISQAFAPEIP